MSCGYDLTGLRSSDLCPECASPIAKSIDTHQRSRSPRAPRWVRVLAIAYFAPLATLVLANVLIVTIEIQRITLWSYGPRDFGAVNERVGWCLAILWVLGWYFYAVATEHSSRLANWVAVTQLSLIVVALLQPATAR